MKTRIQFLALCCCLTAHAAQQIVVPGELANAEGNSSAAAPFNSRSFRFQQVFDASQFVIPAGMSARIDGISLRVDGAATDDVLLFFGGSAVALSTTQRMPDGLSPFFADNVGIGAVTVWNGALSLSGDPASGALPAPFNPVVQVTTPFFYNPSRGNLLLDVSGSGGQVFLHGSLDAQSVAGDSISWVWSADGNSASGTASTLGLVTRFDFTIVPEPATWLLGAAGFAVALVFRRRCKWRSS